MCIEECLFYFCLVITLKNVWLYPPDDVLGIFIAIISAVVVIATIVKALLPEIAEWIVITAKGADFLLHMLHG